MEKTLYIDFIQKRSQVVESTICKYEKNDFLLHNSNTIRSTQTLITITEHLPDTSYFIVPLGQRLYQSTLL